MEGRNTMMEYRITLRTTDRKVTGAVIRGIHSGNKELEVLSVSPKHIVLKRAGFSENPGSRNSGLMSYYPPEVTVYEIIERTGVNNFVCESITSYTVGRSKNKEQPMLPKLDKTKMYNFAAPPWLR